MEPENNNAYKNTETYAEDIARVIGSGDAGMVKKIIHGEGEHEEEKKKSLPESKKNQLFMLFGAIIVLISFAVIMSMFLLKKHISTVEIEKTFTPIIFNDKSTFIEVKDLKKDAIAQSVFNEVVTTNLKEAGLEGIYLNLNKKSIDLKKFISLIEGNLSLGKIPGVGFDNDKFLLGVFNIPTKIETSADKSFFILLKVSSLPEIFSSMRDWENKMFLDLHGFFGLDLSPETKYLLTKNFEDGIIENKNARILRDSNEKIVVMYVLVDDSSIVITNQVPTVREIILRLASSRIQK